eukprot:EC798323.1.p1 GENE.EC798323.1~~EC798323.1.p1  ORF type:complete len:128 (-),score=0.09 EC798323.1:129-512(-)
MVFHHKTRIHVRLLGPCFKTGQRESSQRECLFFQKGTKAASRTHKVIAWLRVALDHSLALFSCHESNSMSFPSNVVQHTTTPPALITRAWVASNFLSLWIALQHTHRHSASNARRQVPIDACPLVVA